MIYDIPQGPDYWVPLVTGPGARVPDQWDPDPTVGKLHERGLVDLPSLDPLAVKALLAAVQERMDRFPLYSDAMSCLLSGPLFGGRRRLFGVVANPLSPLGEPGLHSPGLVLDEEKFSSEMLGDTLLHLNSRMLHGQYAHGPDPLMLVARHETFHMLTLLFARLPHVQDFLERAVGHAIGNPDFTFDDPTVEDRQHLAEQLCLYAAEGVAEDHDEHGNVLHWPVSLFHEMGAEALRSGHELNDEASPSAVAWITVAGLLLEKGGDLATEVNRQLFEQMATNNYLTRTRPRALKDALGQGWFTPEDYYSPVTLDPADDPDLRWELDNPHEPPEFLVQRLRDLHPDTTDEKAREILMHFSLDHVTTVLDHDMGAIVSDELTLRIRTELDHAFELFVQNFPEPGAPKHPGADTVRIRHDGKVVTTLPTIRESAGIPWQGPTSPSQDSLWSANDIARRDLLIRRARASVLAEPGVKLARPVPEDPIAAIDAAIERSKLDEPGHRRTRSRRVVPVEEEAPTPPHAPRPREPATPSPKTPKTRRPAPRRVPGDGGIGH
jgi:hypothetical protein